MGIPIVDNDHVIPKCSVSNDKTDVKNLEPKKSPHNDQRTRKDVVGNCKEVRIECNKNNLRIIGNGNKIRINRNTGNLDIIGNDTRVKIMNNSGAIKYTGNSGRIYLGSESLEQDVDYRGCNGILKVLNAADIRTNGPASDRKEKSKSSYTTSSGSSISDSECGKKSKMTSSSPSPSRLSIRNHISLPNLVNASCGQYANVTSRINLSCTGGCITIQNAVNVAI